MTNGSGRDVSGRFTVGNPGGPGASRRRSSELRRAAEEAITPEHIAAMIRKATRLALEGNLAAMRLVFERTSGRAAEAAPDQEPVGLSLPRLRTAADCNAAIERVIDSMLKGAIDREAAKVLIQAIETRVKTLEVTDLEKRLGELERVANAANGASAT